MSSWLQNVGTFLEKLDDRAERVAEEKEDHAAQDDHGPNIESILAARGLSGTLKDDEDEDEENHRQRQREQDGDNVVIDNDNEEEGENDNKDSAPVAATENPETAVEAGSDPEETIPAPATDDGWDEELTDHINFSENSDNPEQTRPIEEVKAAGEQEETTPAAPEHVPLDSSLASLPTQSVPPEDTEHPEQTDTIVQEEETGENVVAKSPVSEPLSGEPKIATGRAAQTKDSAPSTAEAKLPSFLSATASPILAAATSSSQTRRGSKKPPPPPPAPTPDNQKELRTLRRSVVSLNQQLEAAEAELRAQREELERAAERMEKDRLRQKEEREKERTRHASEIKAMQQKNEQVLKEARARSDKQIEQIREELREVEDKRMQEGGDWSKELIDAVSREKEMGEKLRCALEEKDTLLNQITILQNQQESLGSRLESLSQTADNAMEREREADQRLDEALTLHAKQISQRQAREAELERTIAELGQALVQARNRVPIKADSETGEGNARLQNAEHEIESLRNQLQYETQRASSLQFELEALSNERTEEATTTHKQNRQHEREVDDLKHKISRLESELREFQGDDPEAGKRGGGNSKDDQENLRQIKQLSEEVLRQREKITNVSSELSALKSRLKAATDRATKAEAALESAQSGGSDSPDLEGVPGMRRRRRGRSPKPATIRSALQLDTLSQSNSTEQIGKALDGLDSFLLQSGKILRYQPLARLLFIMYLIMIHLWTFFLIFVHAHGYETVHGDFGAGQGLPHGPHALMMHHNPPEFPGQPAAAAAAAAEVEQQADQHN